jgi:hypothetical protein
MALSHIPSWYYFTHCKFYKIVDFFYYYKLQKLQKFMHGSIMRNSSKTEGYCVFFFKKKKIIFLFI